MSINSNTEEERYFPGFIQQGQRCQFITATLKKKQNKYDLFGRTATTNLSTKTNSSQLRFTVVPRYFAVMRGDMVPNIQYKRGTTVHLNYPQKTPVDRWG